MKERIKYYHKHGPDREYDESTVTESESNNEDLHDTLQILEYCMTYKKYEEHTEICLLHYVVTACDDYYIVTSYDNTINIRIRTHETDYITVVNAYEIAVLELESRRVQKRIDTIRYSAILLLNICPFITD